VHTLSVLVVEDSPLHARLIQALLSPAGLLVTLAGDAETGVKALQEMTPDLILMDMELPGMSGLDLTRMLKADPSRCQIPILALTANNSSQDQQTIADAGCDGFIAKPIDPAHFVDQILLFVPAALPSAPVIADGEYEQTEKRMRFLSLKKNFLLEGAAESNVLLEAVGRGANDLVLIDKLLHRWIGCGTAAGIPEITDRARKMRDLIPCSQPDLNALTEEAQALKKLFDAELATFVA
jgi:two-component system cell cycle response regulator DivK